MSGERNQIAVKCADEILADFISEDDIGERWDVDDKSWVYETIRQIIEKHLQSQASLGEWTKDKPKEPGFFWFKSEAFSGGVVKVSRNAVHFTSGLCISLDDIKGQWSGPLQPLEGDAHE